MGSSFDYVARGKSAMQYFHNQALKYPENYKMPFDALIEYLDGQDNPDSPPYLHFFYNLGGAIQDSGINEQDLELWMESVADQGHGQIPRHLNDFFTGLVQTTQITGWKAIQLTSAGVADGVSSAAKAVGDVSLGTLKSAGQLVQLLPIMAFLGLGFLIYQKAKG